MKKILFLIIIVLMIIPSIYSQSNIGIFVGGGVSDMRFRTDSIQLDKLENSEDYNYRAIYQAGFNFENVLIEKLLYLQFGIHGKSSGFSGRSDSVGMYFHNIHIPLELKYKLFFNKRGEGYIYASGGPYVAMAYRGIQYDQDAVDHFLETEDGNSAMYNPRIKLGKSEEDDVEPFDFGVNIGLGFGYSNLQIGYNFGLGLSNVIPSENLEPIDGEDMGKYKFLHGYHTLTVGFYFSNN